MLHLTGKGSILDAIGGALNTAGNAVVAGVKDVGDLGSLGVANLTHNQQAAQNARSAISSNDSNLSGESLPANAAGLGRDVGGALASAGQFIPQFAEDYSNTFANLGNRLGGGQDQPIQQNMGGNPFLNKTLKYSGATGKNKQLASSAGQVLIATTAPAVSKVIEPVVAGAVGAAAPKAGVKLVAGLSKGLGSEAAPGVTRIISKGAAAGTAGAVNAGFSGSGYLGNTDNPTVGGFGAAVAKGGAAGLGLGGGAELAGEGIGAVKKALPETNEIGAVGSDVNGATPPEVPEENVGNIHNQNPSPYTASEPSAAQVPSITPKIDKPNLNVDANTLQSMAEYALTTDKKTFTNGILKNYWAATRQAGLGDLAGGYNDIFKTLRDENGLDLYKFYDETKALNKNRVNPGSGANIGGDIADPKVWAKAMGITEDQARQDIERGQAPPKLGPTPEVTPLEAATIKQSGQPRQLSPEERRAIINEQENQQTANKVELKTKEGNTKGAIAEAEGIETERQSRFNNADRLGKKLDGHDQQLLSERADPNVKIEPHNPEAFDKAAKAYDDAYDYHLASVRAAGGATLRYGEGKYAPLYLKATTEQMDKLDIPDSERIQKGAFTGFRDATRQYRSYTDAKQKAGLEPLNGSPLEDARMYADKSHVPLRNALLRGALEKSNPTEISDVGKGFDAAGKPFRQGAGAELPFNVSENVDKYLKNYHAPYEPNSTVGKVMVKSAEKVNAVSKRALWFGSMFHYGNETMSFLGSNLLHPIVVAKGVSRAIETAASKQGWQNILEGARTTTINGTSILEGARSMGVELPENSRLNRVSSAFSLTQAEAALKAGIDPNSAEGVAAGSLINKIAGQKNTAVEGASPGIDRFIGAGAAAPRWTPSQLALVRDAFTKPGIGRFTEGGGARNVIIGKRALGAAVGITGSALIAGRLPTLSQAAQEAGLNLNNPVPNIKIKSKNSKGEGQVIDSPTDPLGLAVGLAKNPSHFLQSRFSPALSAGVKIATNTNWNGDPLVDTNQPGAWKTRIAKALENSVTPIGVQNFTNLQHNQNNPNVEQGAIQEIGGRLKTDPNDPQAKANANYFKVLGETTDELKKGGQYGQYWAQKFNDLHPANTTDASGQKYPVPFDPASSATKYDAYTATNAQGQRVLSPVFFADQRLAQATPGYPSSPLYSLDGEGVNVDGSGASQALVALEYQHAQDPAAKTVILNANGGENGWLAKYENEVADYSKNYQQNLTTYFQGLGWTPKAIDHYWANHPSTLDPIDDVSFDQPTTDLINQYYQLGASGDSTAASKFFSEHADVLGSAFDQIAQHSNALRDARGELQLQGYPAESAHVKEVLSAMPQGADKASKKARAVAINGNSDVNQYLSEVALYEALGKGAQFRYKNPSNMAATEAENINNGGQAGQTFLKDVVSLGKYGISSKTGADGNDTYVVDPEAAFAAGGSGSGGSGRSAGASAEITRLKNAAKAREVKGTVKYAYHPAKVFIRGKKNPHFQKIKIASAQRPRVNIKAKSTPVV